MLGYYQKISVAVLFVFVDNAIAMSRISDGDLIISLRDERPCFSYPIDEETKKGGYSFGYLSVIWNDGVSSLPGHLAWELELAPGSKDLANPSSQESCVGYGYRYPGTQEKEGPAKPIRYGIPYNAHMMISTTGVFSKRKYETWFCLNRDLTGAIVLLKAERNRSTSKYECVPPEKIDKRGFFERLFGKDAP